MLEEILRIDKIEVLADGTVQVREIREVLKDGQVIASNYNRRSVGISDSDPDLSWMDDASRAVVEAARTPERLAAAQQDVTL